MFTIFNLAAQTKINDLSHIRCEIPPEVREYVRVTSWLHEEGTAIEIFPEKVKNFLTTDKQLFDQITI